MMIFGPLPFLNLMAFGARVPEFRIGVVLAGLPSCRASAAWFLLPFVLAILLLSAGSGRAQDESGETKSELAAAEVPDQSPLVEPLLTGSPRQTLRTFLRLRDELEANLASYGKARTRSNLESIDQLMPQFRSLIDLAQTPAASRREIGDDTTAYLIDIFGRLPLPDLDSVPDDASLDGDKPLTSWRIPKTPLFISRVAEGPRTGEFLFSSRTVDVAPTFFRRIESQPLKSQLGIESWSRAIPQIAGPMIPAGLAAQGRSSLPASVARTDRRLGRLARLSAARIARDRPGGAADRRSQRASLCAEGGAQVSRRCLSRACCCDQPTSGFQVNWIRLSRSGLPNLSESVREISGQIPIQRAMVYSPPAES